LKAVIERLRHVPVLPRGVTVPPLKATTAEPLPPSFESKHYEPDVLLSDLLGRPPPTHSLDKGALMMKTVKELQGISKSLNISTTRRAKKVMVEKIIAARKKQISTGSSIRRMSHRRKRELAENEIESGNSSRLLKNFMKL
jgi:hypothetical protein